MKARLGPRTPVTAAAVISSGSSNGLGGASHAPTCMGARRRYGPGTAPGSLNRSIFTDSEALGPRIACGAIAGAARRCTPSACCHFTPGPSLGPRMWRGNSVPRVDVPKPPAHAATTRQCALLLFKASCMRYCHGEPRCGQAASARRARPARSARVSTDSCRSLPSRIFHIYKQGDGCLLRSCMWRVRLQHTPCDMTQ